MTIVLQGLGAPRRLVTQGYAPTSVARAPDPARATTRRLGPDPSKATSKRL